MVEPHNAQGICSPATNYFLAKNFPSQTGGVEPKTQVSMLLLMLYPNGPYKLKSWLGDCDRKTKDIFKILVSRS